MNANRNKLLDRVLGMVLLMAGINMLLGFMIPSRVYGEDAKCKDNTCKVIKYYWNCTGDLNGKAIGGFAQMTDSCYPCTQPTGKATPGRCSNGTNQTCTDSGMKQSLAKIDGVTRVCDCQDSLPWANGGLVEGTGNYTGTYRTDPAYPNIYVCKDGS